MAGVLASGTGQMLVTGYAEHNFEPGPYPHEQTSDAYSLMGLRWRLHAQVWRFEPNDALLPWLLIQFEDAGEEGTTTVYSAKAKFSMLLPNGQLVVEREDQVRHRFAGEFGLCIDGWMDPELNFIGPQQQLLCESFIVRADIEVHGEPTILRSPTYHHAIQIGPLEDCSDQRVSVAGYHKYLRRLVFWIASPYTVTCWAVSPLVPTSLEQLCRQETERWDELENYYFPTTFSNDKHLTACVTRDEDHTYHLYILHLGTKELVHRQYANPGDEDDRLEGLAHTRRGWITWKHWGQGFYLLRGNQNQMQFIPLFLDDFPRQLAANYNWFVVSYPNRLQVWDLASPELRSYSYDHQLTRLHQEFRGYGDKMLVLEYPDVPVFGFHYGNQESILSKIELGQNECKIQQTYTRIDSDTFTFDRIAYDEGKLVLVEEKRDKLVVQTVWMGGDIPTVKEMATMEIQRRTGSREMMETAMGVQSVWQGGMTEEKIREILKVIYKRKPVPIMN